LLILSRAYAAACGLKYLTYALPTRRTHTALPHSTTTRMNDMNKTLLAISSPLSDSYNSTYLLLLTMHSTFIMSWKCATPTIMSFINNKVVIGMCMTLTHII